jgi:hypothetical protein
MGTHDITGQCIALEVDVLNLRIVYSMILVIYKDNLFKCNRLGKSYERGKRLPGRGKSESGRVCEGGMLASPEVTVMP